MRICLQIFASMQPRNSPEKGDASWLSTVDCEQGDLLTGLRCKEVNLSVMGMPLIWPIYRETSCRRPWSSQASFMPFSLFFHPFTLYTAVASFFLLHRRRQQNTNFQQMFVKLAEREVTTTCRKRKKCSFPLTRQQMVKFLTGLCSKIMKFAEKI